MNKFALARKIASGVLSLNEAIKRHGKLLAFAALTVLGVASGMCQGDPDATTIATAAQTAFNTVAPIIVSIATFFVVVRIAKRVVS